MIRLAQESKSTFSVNFGGENEIDLTTLSDSLSSIHCLLQIISKELNEDAYFKFQVCETRKGSFEIEFATTVIPTLHSFFVDNMDLASLTTQTLINILSLKNHLKGKLPKEISESTNGNRTIINAHDQSLVVNAQSVNIYTQQPNVDTLVNNIFEANDRPSFSVNTSDGTTLKIPQQDYSNMSAKIDVEQIDTPEINRTTEVTRVTLSVKQPDVCGNSKWTLHYMKNIKATIRDIDFLRSVRNGDISINGRTQLVADLEYSRLIDHDGKTLKEHFAILRVHQVKQPDVQIRQKVNGEQQSLDI